MIYLNHQNIQSKITVPLKLWSPAAISSSLAISHPPAHSFQAAGKGMINDYSSGSPPNSLRLLCSITGESVVRCVRLFPFHHEKEKEPETTGLAVAAPDHELRIEFVIHALCWSTSTRRLSMATRSLHLLSPLRNFKFDFFRLEILKKCPLTFHSDRRVPEKIAQR